MAWSWLQSASHESAAAQTTVAATYGSNLSSGSKLIAIVSSDTASVPTGVSDGTNNFTSGGSVTGSTGGGVGLSLWFLDTPAGDVGTKPTITASGITAGTNAILIAEVSGLKTGNTTALALDGTAATSQVTSAATVGQPSYSSTAANEFLITCNGDNGGPQTWTDPTGYQGATVGPGSAGAVTGLNFQSGANLELAYKNSSNGAESGTWSFSASGGAFTGTAFLVVAFKIAAGGGPPAFPPGTLVRRQAWPRQFVRRGRVTNVVPKQLNPPYPFTEIRQWRQPRGFFPRRGKVSNVVPPQFNPPYPWAEIRQRRQTWPRGLPKRGHVYWPVPGQDSPVIEAVQKRQPWPRALLRRGRVYNVVPPQFNPPYPFTEIRQWRQIRGMWPRRGRRFDVVPPQQAATPNPPITFQNARHQRVLFQRRGHVFTPVPPQDAPVAEVVQRRQEWPRGLPRRGRQAQPVPAQPTVVNPAWVQAHRSPMRAIPLIRRRFRQLMPWPAPAHPVVQQGTATIVNTLAGTATIVNTLAGTATVVNTLAGSASISNTLAGTATIVNNLAGTATIVNDL